MKDHEVWAKLVNACDDYEIATLFDLGRAAGIVWQCPECGADTFHDEAECEDCGKPKSGTETKPVEEP